MFNRIYGSVGKIDVPSVGLLVGEMSSWDLRRREELSPGKGDWVLRALFSSLVPWLMEDPALKRRIVIEIARGKQYRLEPDDDARMVLDGRSLLVEGVSLCPLQP